MSETVVLPTFEVKLVRSAYESYTPVTIASPPDVVQFLSWMREKDREYFQVVLLNSRHEIIGTNTVSIGTASAALVHPREVFKPAILSNSHTIICAHNHPTGDPSPSREDLDITRQLIEAGKLLGIQLLDHIVIGDRPYSIRENHESLWS